MAFSGSQTTRHGLYGGPRGLYGSFDGKSEAEPVIESLVAGALGVQPYLGGTITITPAVVFADLTSATATAATVTINEES